MAPESSTLSRTLAPTPSNGVSPEQTLNAAKALLAHLERSNHDRKDAQEEKLGLLDEDVDASYKEQPICLVVSAKQYFVSSSRLLPGKIHMPHSLRESKDLRLCIITADPPNSNPKAYKNLFASQEFPAELRARIARVIRFSRLRAKYKSFESLRQLFAEYDVFLADDRIISLLPHTLGKVFYKTASKRPIPVVLADKKKPRSKEVPEQDRAVAKLARKRKFSEIGGPESIGTAASIAAEIEKALSSALVNLTQSTNCEIRIAKAGWPADRIAENVRAVADRMVERFVPKKWNGVRGIYIKAQRSAALPIWLAEELWTGEEDILGAAAEHQTNGSEEGLKPAQKLLLNAKGAVQRDVKPRRRKNPTGEREARSSQRAKKLKVDGELKKDDGKRKAKLKELKAQAMLEAQGLD